MPYPFYKVVHFLGIFTMLTVLAAMSMHAMKGGTKADVPHRRPLMIAHGVATLFALTGGFGMLARLGAFHGALPGWVFLKLALWLVLAAAPWFVHRGRTIARAAIVALPLVAALGGAIALYKPL